MPKKESNTAAEKDLVQTPQYAQHTATYAQPFEDDTIDLYEMWITLWSKKWLVIGVTAVAALGSVVFALLQPPVYKAEESEEFYEDQPYLYYDLHIHELNSKYYGEGDYPDFTGSVYMRREYSSEESEKFRELLIKSYKISVLDKEYVQNVNSVLTSIAEGTTDADKGIENISNLTRTYDGKAKMFLDYEVTTSEVVTLDMITWVRENFVMESMTDGVPRGVMSKRLDNVNNTVEK